MTTQSIRDQRLFLAIDLITSGRIKLLSIDIFDTLLARRVPKPTDVFLRLGVKLRNQNKLSAGQSPDSFAAIRYQTEYAARDAQQRQHGNREVTLSEIYNKVPPQVVNAAADELVALEIATEHELCFVNPEIIQLAQHAKQRGVKLCLISNSYFSKQVIENLVQSKAADLPKLNGIFVSSEHRRGKRDGLMQIMLDTFKIKPTECLHIGDDPVSDRETTNKLGIPCIFFGYSEDDFSARISEEHPIQWHDRTARYADKNGDYGQTWLRRQLGYWQALDIKDEEKAFYTYGAQMLGPLLTGFAGWVSARLKAEKAERIYGITREGELLTELVSMLDDRTDCRILATSRLTAALASFAPEYPEHLEDFLTRRGHWTLGALMEQLGFDAEQAKTIENPNTTLETLPAHKLTQKLLTSPLAKDLFVRSAERRKRLLKHLKKIGALDNKRLFLLDLGYAATIQRAIQRIFTIEKISVTTHGLYLVSAHVSLATQAAGGIVEGFLAQNGNPNDFASAFCRSPEVVELSCMPPYGTVIDYEKDGTPVYAKDTTPKSQLHEVGVVQRGIKNFTKSFSDLTRASSPDFCNTSWQAQIRDIATRTVLYPTKKEAQLVSLWQADSDLGLTSPRAIISAGPYSPQINAMTAPQMAGLPRRDVPWLYGVAACANRALARQVASIMLRKEEFTVFALPTVSDEKNPEYESAFWLSGMPRQSQIGEMPVLKRLCDSAINEYKKSGHLERSTWMQLFMQPSLSARRFVYSYVAEQFQKQNETHLANGLYKKLWRIGERSAKNFACLWPLFQTHEPTIETWQFLKEALFAAMAKSDPDYAIDVIDRMHGMTFNGYRARITHIPFQDTLLVGAAKQALRSLRPNIQPPRSAANRPLRLCYALAGEIGENYSPLTDIALSLAEIHDPNQVEVVIVSVHTESEVMSSSRLRTRIEQWRAKGCTIYFWPPLPQNGPAANLQHLANQLAAHNLDALIFPVLTNLLFSLAALRPAQLMVGLGLGNIDFYTSPLLDFTAHISDFPVMDGLCDSYRIPGFIPEERTHQPKTKLAKTDLGVADDTFIILSSGRPIKFYSESYWRVITNVLTTTPTTHLVILGPTIEDISEWLKPLIPVNLLKRIHFLGWRPDHGEVLATADIMLDTFPMSGGYTLVEAMNLGIPTVMCRNKTEDFFEPYTEQKWMPIGDSLPISDLNFDWDNAKGIEEAVLRLINQPKLRQALSAAVRQTAYLQGSARGTAESLENLIRKRLELLSRPS